MAEYNFSPEWQTAAVRLLRSRTTQQYFNGTGWTSNPTHAQPYPNDEEAMRACASHSLQEMELVLFIPNESPSGGKELSATPIVGVGMNYQRLPRSSAWGKAGPTSV